MSTIQIVGPKRKFGPDFTLAIERMKENYGSLEYKGPAFNSTWKDRESITVSVSFLEGIRVWFRQNKEILFPLSAFLLLIIIVRILLWIDKLLPSSGSSRKSSFYSPNDNSSHYTSSSS